MERSSLISVRNADAKTGELTLLLRRWKDGDPEALEVLWPLVQTELQRVAHLHMRAERGGHTLQTTALVNEAFLRLVGQKRVRWQDRKHFLSVASAIMRRILVDHARRHLRQRRGGDAVITSLDAVEMTGAATGAESAHVLSVDRALRRLARLDGGKVKLVQLKYFAGFSLDETAEILGWSRAKVVRQWRMTKAWLQRELERN